MTIGNEVPTPVNDCFRCGYDLRGINDDQPCPECGLLAQRSRVQTMQPRDARPGWLRKLSVGIWLILLAEVFVLAWWFIVEGFFDVSDRWYLSYFWGRSSLQAQLSTMLGYDLAALSLCAGVFLLTARQRIESLDLADRQRRRAIRWCLLGPVCALLIAHIAHALWYSVFIRGSAMWGMRYRVVPKLWGMVVILLTAGCVPLVYLLLARLRSIAVRALNPSLAEYCTIIGIGGSASIAFAFVSWAMLTFGEGWGFGYSWASRSTLAFAIMLIETVSLGLFWLWSVYTMVRFAIALWLESIAQRRLWRESDRSAS